MAFGHLLRSSNSSVFCFPKNKYTKFDLIGQMVPEKFERYIKMGHILANLFYKQRVDYKLLTISVTATLSVLHFMINKQRNKINIKDESSHTLVKIFSNFKYRQETEIGLEIGIIWKMSIGKFHVYLSPDLGRSLHNCTK